MDKIKIKVKKLNPNAVLPTQAHPDEDAGYDLCAIDDGKDVRVNGIRMYREYGTGIAIEPPIGYHVEIAPRSSITNKCHMLKNSLGIIDQSYRGELMFRFFIPNKFEKDLLYKKGDKIGQILIRKTIHADFIESSELSDTKRGSGGYGSSDKTTK